MRIEREGDDPRYQWEKAGRVIRIIGPSDVAHENGIAWSSDASDLIDEQIRHFTELQRDFTWKVYAHDSPADLRERLVARGFEPGPAEAILVLDAQEARVTGPVPAGCVLEQVTTPAGIADLVALQERVWKEDLAWWRNTMEATLRDAPDRVFILLARVDGQAVSSGMVHFHARKSFAMLGGASTLPEFRGRGLYKAIVARRIAEVRARGVRYAATEAHPMSRPILERAGFEHLATAVACLWKRAR